MILESLTGLTAYPAHWYPRNYFGAFSERNNQQWCVNRVTRSSSSFPKTTKSSLIRSKNNIYSRLRTFNQRRRFDNFLILALSHSCCPFVVRYLVVYWGSEGAVMTPPTMGAVVWKCAKFKSAVNVPTNWIAFHSANVSIFNGLIRHVWKNLVEGFNVYNSF